MNPLEKDYLDYQKLLSCGLKIEEALSKMKLSKPPPSREENYQNLLDIWNHDNMCTFKDFLRWYNNKHVVPTLKPMQKMVAFYHKKRIDMLKLGCTHPNLANICLHKSTTAKFYPFTETIRTCCKRFEKIWLVVLLSSSHVKLWSMKLLSGIQEIFVNLSLALTQVSCILILCASPCQQDYTRDGNMTQNLIDLYFNRTNPETLRTWLCHISEDKDLSVKLRVSTPQELRKRLIVSK